MLTTRKQDGIHKFWLLQVLTDITEDVFLSQSLAFKGGTCAALRGLLNRFSVDLDFDLLAPEKEIPKVRNRLEKIFSLNGLEIKDKSQKAPQYFLKYPVKTATNRNTLKIDVSFPAIPTNDYEDIHLTEIDRIVKCQTVPTMVANKLIALISRYEKTKKIAGRDVYDVYHFLMNGYEYKKEIIESVRGESIAAFFTKLIDLVETKINTTVINQDLNFLLPDKEFQKIRKILKQQTLVLLRDELARNKQNS